MLWNEPSGGAIQTGIGVTEMPAITSFPIDLVSKGSWITAVDETQFFANEVGLIVIGTFETSLTNRWMVDLAIGAAGSERLIMENIPIQLSLNEYNDGWFLQLPIEIPNGSRLSIRAAKTSNQSGNSNESIRCKVMLSYRRGNTCYSGVRGIGYEFGTSGSTQFLRPLTITTSGLWQEVAASAEESFRLIYIALQEPQNGLSSTPRGQFVIEVALGAQGSETAIIQCISYMDSSGTILYPWFFGPFPVNIEKGSRVTARTRQNGNSISLTLLGFF